MELEQLKAAILRNQQAAGNMAGLDEQYARSEVLRDQPGPQINRYGTVSPLSIIANTINRSKGRMDSRDLAPQREQARTDIAEGEAAMQGENLRQALAKEQLGLDKFEEEKASNLFEQTYKTQKEEKDRLEEQRKAAMESDGEDWVSPDGKTTAGGGVDAKGVPYIMVDGQRVNPVEAGWQRENSSSSFGVRGKAMTTEQRNNIGNRAQRVVELNRLATDFRGNFAKVRNVPTQFANNFLMATSKSDLMKYVDEGTDQQGKDNAQWWADFRYNMLERRHELFGATLTKNEQVAWDEALLISPGMDSAEIEKRLARLTDSENERLVREGNMGMTDPLESNRNAYSVGMEGVLEWNPDTQRYSVPGMEEVVTETATADPNAAPPDAPPAELTPEMKNAYGKMIQGFEPEIMAHFQGLESPVAQRRFLDQFYNELNSMQQ